MSQLIALIFLGIFVVVMLVIGFTSMGKTKTMSEFLLGGRNIGAWMSAFAYGTTYFSAVIFIGYAGKTGWQIGIGGIWIGIGNALLGSLLAWKFLAKRTRSMTHRLNASTMPEFFQARYLSRNMKILAALIIFVFLLPYSASVYMGLGYLFSAVFPHVSYIYCMLFIAVLTAAYLITGGYVATALTDFIQGIIMIAGVILMVACIVTNPVVGGLSAGFAKLRALEGGTGLVNLFGGENWFSLVSMIMLTSFGAWGLPQMVHKFYAIRDEKSINKAMVISTAFAAIIGMGAYFVGTFGRLFLNNTLPKEGYDKIVPDMLVAAISKGILSNVLLSVILLLVLSASMSTLAAHVLTSSSAI
ncbi:MAG: sodium:solute symporter, partial [Bacillota bacterium]|nr:sodium:solute symporter [Bacillota bacterium]